jgi:allophanate hydrolase subunit 2
VAGLFVDAYGVSPVSNRVACRLAGKSLSRTRADELPPEGLVLGAIQVPPDGQPLVFLADHPTTGGYPVVGVVDDVTPLAQARPGTSVRFRELD